MKIPLRAVAPLLLLPLAACPPKTITRPGTDTTGPNLLVLTLQPPGQQETGVPVTLQVGPDDVVPVRVLARDQDGGIQDVQVWMTTTRWTGNTQTGPGLAGAPVASNPNPAAVGAPTSDTREVTYSIDIAAERGGADRLRVEVWAEAVNFGGMKSVSPQAVLLWP